MTDFVRAKNTETKEYELIDLNNILIIKQEYEVGYSLLIDKSSSYLFPISLNGFYEILESYSLYKIAPKQYVNLSQIKKCHSELLLLFFDNVPSVKFAKEKRLLYIQTSERNVKEIKKLLNLSHESDLAYELSEVTSRNSKNTVFWKKARLTNDL